MAEKVLQAGAEVVLFNVRPKFSFMVGSVTKYETRSTGVLEGTHGMSPVKQDRSRNHDMKIGFSESRSGGKSNTMLANLLEYGKSSQTPKISASARFISRRRKCG